jgi:flagellin-specific chaperone FliS
MLALSNTPRAAYRRVAVDARIHGASQADLVALCFEQIVGELGGAIHAHATGDTARRSEGLTRAHAALTALEMGLDRSQPVAGAMLQLYGAARERILRSVTDFDPVALKTLRDDFREIGTALARAGEDMALAS